jgi:hypothetical protein
MPEKEDMQISVSLSESHWRAILEILRSTVRARDGAWARWGEYIDFSIEAAIQDARMSSIDMASPSEKQEGSSTSTRGTLENVGYVGPRCPRCGSPMYAVGEYEALSSHIYQCTRCDETISIPMTRDERISRGDYDFLEDWEMGMVDDL